ncbi:MAG TPA: glutamate--cysteine ligase [Gemmataceae bacterium]
MSRLEFTRNDRPTLGVEIELQLVDAETFALKNCILEVLERVPEGLRGRVKPELMQSYLEINTEVCRDVGEVERDLREKLRAVDRAVRECGARLCWAATHPFSPWHEQLVTPTERYYRLVDNLQQTARRLVTFGLHVHVGVDSGDKAVMICDRLMRHLPTLLALSVNSPYWGGRDTGLHSARSKVMEGLPTAGLPPLMRNWSEYVWLVNHLVQTKFIETIREIWWDARPHNNFGTVEVRVCDMPADLSGVLALTALVQSLVYRLSEQIDEGMYQFDCHPMLVRQNKWRACRFGTEALLVDPYTLQVSSVREMVEDLIPRLEPTARELGCAEHLARVRTLIEAPMASARQREVFQRTGDLREVVKAFLYEGG